MWLIPLFPGDLVIFTEEFLIENLIWEYSRVDQVKFVEDSL